MNFVFCVEDEMFVNCYCGWNLVIVDRYIMKRCKSVRCNPEENKNSIMSDKKKNSIIYAQYEVVSR